ncbi:MAG: hypothetical protein DSY50_01055 [Desulfobulbus sp.]|nr:MAG: hypothetical protein DSY50_01055 [Desulfobulbus sp.]RUM39429.1 MAG: hypothetical protein DSY58_00475 [Desulfobulbus sp.]
MQHNDESRRSFLKTVLAGSAAVATVTVTGKKANAAKKGIRKTGEVLYTETPAFKEYYNSLR